ncbi:hypothetical protein GCM10009569_34750 [Arthrobacter russicus]
MFEFFGKPATLFGIAAIALAVAVLGLFASEPNWWTFAALVAAAAGTTFAGVAQKVAANRER